MLDDKQIEVHLACLENKLLKADKQNVKLVRSWVKDFPSNPGVYVVFENEKLVYVGETGNIRKRMRDLLDSRNHTLRRSIGKRHYSKEDGYKNATSNRNFPEHIEHKVAAWMENNLTVCALPVSMGRKELEELIQYKYRDQLYNQRGRRTA